MLSDEAVALGLERQPPYRPHENVLPALPRRVRPRDVVVMVSPGVQCHIQGVAGTRRGRVAENLNGGAVVRPDVPGNVHEHFFAMCPRPAPEYADRCRVVRPSRCV